MHCFTQLKKSITIHKSIFFLKKYLVNLKVFILLNSHSIIAHKKLTLFCYHYRVISYKILRFHNLSKRDNH